MNSTQPTLADLTRLLRGAGDILRTGYGLQHDVRLKGDADLVTEMDHQSERYIVDSIRASFGDHMIVAEESGELAGDRDCIWYVDPLDGTVNYAHGIPFFTVTLAYAEKGRLVLGGVYDPMRDECFTAERGQGAWLNGQPIRVSGVDALAHSLLATGFASERRYPFTSNVPNFIRLNSQTMSVRRLGSAALELAYVACGRLDGFWEMGISSYDIAGGALLVEEAGGICTAMDGQPGYLEHPCSILAAASGVHAHLLQALHQPVSNP